MRSHPRRAPVRRAPRPAPHVLRLGSGDVRAAGVGAKAAWLDDATAAGLPVPVGGVLLGEALDTAVGAGTDDAALAGLLGPLRPGRRVAVRSAFDAEDAAGTSLAGAYRTVLDVPTDDAARLGAALRAVHASGSPGSSAPVVPRRRDVLVLALVAAEHAGVAASEDDYADDLVAVVAGTAERLVAGDADGERVLLPRLRRGERPRSVDGTSLPGWAARLARLLRRVRVLAGSPPSGAAGWDVEWADDGRRCWLLQLRPLVAATRRDEAFTLANHREILPPLPSVLMASLIAENEGGLYGYYRRADPRLPSGRPFVEVVEGRPYLNLSLLQDTVRHLGLPTAMVADTVGGDSDVDVPLRPLRLLRSAPALARLGRDALTAPSRAAARYAPSDAAAREAVRSGDLVSVVDAAGATYVGLVSGLVPLSTSLGPSLAVLRRAGVLAEHAARSRTAGGRLWDGIGELAHEAAGLPADDRAALADGRLPRSPGSAGLRDALARWTEAHGHRGVHESDLAWPRFTEDPTPVLRAVAAGPTPAATPPPRTAAGVLTLALWWRTRASVVAREDLRDTAMRTFAVLRAGLLRGAEQAVAGGLLPAVDDLWLLTAVEVRALARGRAPGQELLDARQAEREHQARFEPPDLLHRFDDLERWRDAGAAAPDDGLPGDGGALRLRGLGLTGGRVRGRVWCSRDPRATPPRADRSGTERLVLVAPAVDAGWVPLLSAVAAVVVETGGDLSHGSMVLRERGLPSVTNVRRALARLRDGDEVEVDAGAGVVRRLARSSP